MDFKKEKQVRFHKEEKLKFEAFLDRNEPQIHDKQLPLYKNSDPSWKSVGGYRDKIAKFGRSKVFPEGQEPEKKTVLDPGSELVLKWNRIFLVFCLMALFVDPLFFYLPSVLNRDNSSCMQTDLKLGIIVTFFRTVADVFYLLHVIMKFRTAYVAPSSRVFGKGELVMDLNKIAWRYLKSEFFIDVIAALPLPQIVIWSILPAIRSSHADHTNNALVLIVLLQYIPRLYLIFPLSSQIIKATGVVTKTAWAGAAYNLLLYMLASHTYLQSITVRLEEWRLKRRDTEEWMRHRQLPDDLQQRVRRYTQYKWLTTRGVDEETILRALPTDLRRDIQRHLCLDLVRRVPFFSQMDDQLLDAICERLVSSLSTPGTYIVREGDPVTEMLFIIRGTLESSTTNGGRSGFFNTTTLGPSDFCGEELLAWALLPRSTLNLPTSTRTVRALSEVEAFALRAEELKFVANQFRRLHSKKLQHTFRYYSHHWRTWAACFIQAAWRRHQKRMTAKSLSIMESFYLSPDLQIPDENDEEEPSAPENSSQAIQNLGVTILASRFAANTRRGAQKIKHVEMPKLQKPEEPDFLAEPDDE
ncbi:UNVERIFIED_CONTAM: putative cyclic nucleotide-gated ion channel 14 [Sesamum radiatum]|uniref:Cyclic nucleotide-gated ion channel 14 n=1 Tax=Sesamum radiatum TaxID=300843 RepID=A0AAW2JT22_SESRA